METIELEFSAIRNQQTTDVEDESKQNEIRRK